MKNFNYGACKLIRNNVLSINELNVSNELKYRNRWYYHWITYMVLEVVVVEVC